MQRFAELLDALSTQPSRNGKIALIEAYFRATPDPDRGWALAALTDGVPVKVPLRRLLNDLMAQRIDQYLYKVSRDYVGDTAETVALLWSGDKAEIKVPSALPLGRVVELVETSPRETVEKTTAALLDQFDVTQRWAFLKFLGGALRVGVSARLAKIALAQYSNGELSEIEEVWHTVKPPYVDLFAWLDGRAERPSTSGLPAFRPLMLATAIEEADWPALAPEDFAAEWKWDGIRVQISSVCGVARIFSRGGEDISTAFPEIADGFADCNATVDGELLIVRDAVVADFNDLQQRLNRKTVSRRMLSEYPAHVRLYDLLILGDQDLRPMNFDDRRARLEQWHETAKPDRSSLSSLIPFQDFADLRKLHETARDASIEGLMLKRRTSPYLAGRPKGHWFKWKRSALTLDCVLMYAQRGSGKRSSFYSDYTFGVWQPGEAGELALVPIGKAYSGFTDAELKELDKFIRENTVEAFGPVRSVRPLLVLEVAFDALQRSKRHKSGLAMRFPRIHRIRWDKPANEADTLQTAYSLLPANMSAPIQGLAVVKAK